MKKKKNGEKTETKNLRRSIASTILGSSELLRINLLLSTNKGVQSNSR